MARLKTVHIKRPDHPPSFETLDVRLWGPSGSPEQAFCLHQGTNFNAAHTFLLEVSHCLQGAPIYTTRNFLQVETCFEREKLSTYLQHFASGESDSFGFGEMLPETHLSLTRRKHTFQDHTGATRHHVSYDFVIGLDTGVVFSAETPGDRMHTIELRNIPLEDGLRFMTEFISELEMACQGRHPDPGLLPPGAGEFPFAVELNRQAYDKLADTYGEEYFEEPALASAFDDWLLDLPPGAQVLDAGCGHGEPVISRLLAAGFQVTGLDLSPAMLRRARQQFPAVTFLEGPLTAITARGAFDAACSFSAISYLDPIDFLHAVHRLHRALRPGGLLFIHGCDPSPTARGDPYGLALGTWMWSWERSLEETAALLEEHGYFQVLQARDITTDQQRQELLADWRRTSLESYEANRKMFGEAFPLPPPDPPPLTSFYYLTARRLERT